MLNRNHNRRGKKQNFRTCSLPHYTGSSTTYPPDGPPVTTASSYRVFGDGPGTKYLYAEIHGKVFPDSDAASEALAEKGYGTEYFARESVVSEPFKDLDFKQKEVRFDALYRYWKKINKLNIKKEGHEKIFSVFLLGRGNLESQVHKLAREVGIFHRCTKTFNPDFPKQFVVNVCRCGAKVKTVWPYQGKGETKCFDCRLKLKRRLP